MTRQAIGEALAARLYAAETAVDLALAETAALIAALPSARAEAYLSAVVGQRAFDGAAASVSALAGWASTPSPWALWTSPGTARRSARARVRAA